MVDSQIIIEHDLHTHAYITWIVLQSSTSSVHVIVYITYIIKWTLG